VIPSLPRAILYVRKKVDPFEYVASVVSQLKFNVGNRVGSRVLSLPYPLGIGFFSAVPFRRRSGLPIPRPPADPEIWSAPPATSSAIH
jgi:hypothetical protein